MARSRANLHPSSTSFTPLASWFFDKARVIIGTPAVITMAMIPITIITSINVKARRVGRGRLTVGRWWK